MSRSANVIMEQWLPTWGEGKVDEAQILNDYCLAPRFPHTAAQYGSSGMRASLQAVKTTHKEQKCTCTGTYNLIQYILRSILD